MNCIATASSGSRCGTKARVGKSTCWNHRAAENGHIKPVVDTGTRVTYVFTVESWGSVQQVESGRQEIERVLRTRLHQPDLDLKVQEVTHGVRS